MNPLFRLKVIFFVFSLLLSLTSCTKKTPPVVSISDINVESPTSATAVGSVNDDGGSDVTSRGVCWSTSENPTIADQRTSDGEGNGTFTSTISPLAAGTEYFIRAYATNSEGVGYSSQESFTTANQATVPDFYYRLISYTSTIVRIRGVIEDNGGSPVTACGVCWSKNHSPDIAGNHTLDTISSGTFVSKIESLTPGTFYYIRAYATNKVGITYGVESGVFTLSEDNAKVTDIDGNNYSVVVIGAQKWMGENLKTTRLNDGEPLVEYSANSTENCFCWYDNDPATYKETYGAFYRVSEDKLCPVGWHIPNEEDWQVLMEFLDRDAPALKYFLWPYYYWWRSKVAGGYLKEAGESHWLHGNDSTTNESGFTALPGGGVRLVNNNLLVFDQLGVNGYYEQGIKSFDGDLWGLGMIIFNYSSNYVYVRINSNGTDLKSVRCIKNNE